MVVVSHAERIVFPEVGRKVWSVGPWAIVGFAFVCSTGCGGGEREARASEAAPD